MSKEMISVEEFEEYCKKCADVQSELSAQALGNNGKGESPTSSLSAYVYFQQREEIYRYLIPNVLKNLLDDKTNKETKGETK